jgi:hypothetical protein
MGTRSLTIVRDEDGKELVTLYRQFDGYPTGHGSDLADFLRGRVIVNGFGGQNPRTTSNGAGCFAASLVETLKAGQLGNVYIYPAGSSDCGEEYTYTLTVSRPDGIAKPDGGAVAVRVVASGWGDRGASGDSEKGRASVVLFDGSAAKYCAWISRKVSAEARKNATRRKAEGIPEPVDGSAMVARLVLNELADSLRAAPAIERARVVEHIMEALRDAKGIAGPCFLDTDGKLPAAVAKVAGALK